MTILGKKQMSEEDIKLNYITPVILNGWKGHMTMETKITDGRINISGNIVARSKPKFADYMLYLNDGKPIAVVEAKDNNHSVSHGLQQAMTYAKMMDIPFAYSSKYLFYYLMSMRQSYIGMAEGGAQPNISKEKIVNSLIPLPPAEEQRRIVAKIEEILPYVDRYAAAYEKLEQFNAKFPQDMKKSILQYAIQGKLVEQREEEGTGEELYRQIQAEKKRLIKEGKIKKEKPLPEIAEDEIPFDIPESWRWVRFSEIMSTMSTGPFGSMLHKTDYIEKGIPLVNPANMVNGKIVPSDKMMISEATRRRLSSYILHAGMIVLGRRGEMGRCAVVTEKEDGWLCGTGSFFMEPSMSLYVYYVVSLFSSPYVKFYLGGESVGTTMSNLNHTILSKMPIPLPPLAEQRRIVAKLDEILPLCERLK